MHYETSMENSSIKTLGNLPPRKKPQILNKSHRIGKNGATLYWGGSKPSEQPTEWNVFIEYTTLQYKGKVVMR